MLSLQPVGWIWPVDPRHLARRGGGEAVEALLADPLMPDFQPYGPNDGVWWHRCTGFGWYMGRPVHGVAHTCQHWAQDLAHGLPLCPSPGPVAHHYPLILT